MHNKQGVRDGLNNSPQHRVAARWFSSDGISSAIYGNSTVFTAHSGFV
ncbi:hypothetical protein RCH06_003418, partial [Polaromonas sp. CG_9.5]|nr:hypothetical protein [Polaromonas sp. CG_9.5]